MIAIKGMEMPNSCSECNLTTRKTWNYAYSINLKDIDCTETKRPKDCPRDAVQTTLNNTPTADAKLIVHAHWIEGQTDNPNIHNILCSHCFSGYPSKGHSNSQYTKKRFKWCPSCGAKMDENERKLKYADENTMMSET